MVAETEGEFVWRLNLMEVAFNITVTYLFTYLFIKKKKKSNEWSQGPKFGQFFYQIKENMGERKQCVWGGMSLYILSVIFCYLLYIATVVLYLILVCDFCW